MTQSIVLKECLATPTDEDGFSPNWVQLFAIQEPERGYFRVMGMEDNRRFSFECEFDEPASMEEASKFYSYKVMVLRCIHRNKYRNK